jgi:hypothetical protein
MVSSRKGSNTAKAPRGLSAEETRAWLTTYRKHSRIYAWGFFAVVVPVVFGVIWWSMGELNQDVFLSAGFFVLVFLILALWTRRKSGASWTGVVSRKFQKKVHVSSRNPDIPDSWEIRNILEIRTDSGKKITFRLTPDLFEYFQEGDRVCKVGGVDWPEKQELAGPRRICVVCGTLVSRDAVTCPRCRGNIPDHPTLCRMAADAS